MSTQNALWAPDDDEPLDVVLPQQRAQTRVAECAAVLLLDDRFAFLGTKLRDDLPRLAAVRDVLVGMLHPHDRTLRRARRLHEPTDRGDQLVTTGHPVDDSVLYVDNQQPRRHAISLPAYARIGNSPDQDSPCPRCNVTEVTASLNPSDPVVVTAIFRPTNGARDAVLAALQPAIAAVHEEPGCLLYAIHEAPDGSIVMIEKWETAALLDAHGKAAAVAALHVALGGHLAAPTEVTRLVPLPMGEESKGAL
ncbi:MAG TPA: putative quinol monooxygenase [Propionibacteriaceae bacterium]